MDREGVSKHWDLVKAFKNGANIEFRLNASEPWVATMIPIFAFESEYRIKPERKVVDLSVLIESKIDCEFTGHTFEGADIDRLHRITRVGLYIREGRVSGGSYGKVRPRMRHAHCWLGGECPLPKGVRVSVLYANGESIADCASRFDWSRNKDTRLIVGFIVLGLVDGYCYPWEV